MRNLEQSSLKQCSDERLSFPSETLELFGNFMSIRVRKLFWKKHGKLVSVQKILPVQNSYEPAIKLTESNRVFTDHFQAILTKLARHAFTTFQAICHVTTEVYSSVMLLNLSNRNKSINNLIFILSLKVRLTQIYLKVKSKSQLSSKFIGVEWSGS